MAAVFLQQRRRIEEAADWPKSPAARSPRARAGSRLPHYWMAGWDPGDCAKMFRCGESGWVAQCETERVGVPISSALRFE